MSFWQHFVLIASLEISFLSVALISVYKSQKSKIYPAFWQLLNFRLATDGLMFVEEFVRHIHLLSGGHAYQAYFYTYWLSFAVDAVLVLRVLHEMFRHALRSIPGVQKLGRPIFFWACAVSVIAAFAAGITPHASGMSLVLASAQVLARSQSIISLCMIAFLTIASRTLGVSYRSRIFGVTFGFALMATANLLNAALISRLAKMTGMANVGLEMVNLAAIGLWAVYFLRPEPQRRLVTVPISSPLMRWNEVAQTLGNPAGQVAIEYPPSFMSDVFELVDNVMGAEGWPRAGLRQPPGPLRS
jgi:hypothetical protein